MEQQKPKQRRGFAAMSPERRKEIASAGGKAAHARGTAHQFTSEEARAAGQKGGEAVSKSTAHMQEIGQRGGAKVSADREFMAEIGRKGGAAVAARPGHMAEISRKGLEARLARRDGTAAGRCAMAHVGGAEE
ncbi:KGG domain-containing protein [Sorangium sp. So ce233]|uniref:KGG domain-containing protein n=1 Tax=Sorangium sp. So ce233 TaxID=3133290 RepID=UPI003F619299